MPRQSSSRISLATAFVLCASTLVQAQVGGKITELGSGGRSFQDRQPDLAHDPVNDVYAHVFMGGTKPHQIRLKLFDAKTGSGVSGGDVAIAGGTNDNINPCVAYIAKTGLFLVAWQEDNGGNWDIKCRAYDPTNKAAGTTVTVAATAADEIDPDLAGDATTVDDDAVLVWDDESAGIRAVEIEVPSPTTVKVLTPQTLATGPKPLHNHPTVSRSGGAARNIVVTWEPAASSIAVTAYTLDLIAASTPLTVALSGSRAAVDGDGRDFVVLFQRPQPSNPNLGDIWGLSVRIPTVPQLPLIQSTAPQALAANPNDEKRPAVAFVGGSYLAAWAVVDIPGPLGKCQIQTLLPDCTSCGTGFLVQYANRPREVEYQAVASEYNSNAATNARRARVMYDTAWFDQNSQQNRAILQKVNFEVLGGGTTTVAQGCGSGGALTMPEPFAFGEQVTATLTGAAASASTSMVLVGVPTMSRFTCGTCSLILTPFVFGIGVTGGSARMPFRIPCDPALAGAEVDFQFAPITPGTSPCNLTPGLSASNILRAKLN